MPKVDIKTLTGKRNIAVQSLNELFEEFNCVHDIKTDPKLLENIYHQVESKYRVVKKQIEAIADRFVDENLTKEHENVVENSEIGEKIKRNYLDMLQKFANSQKGIIPHQNTSEQTVALEAMTDAVRKMAESLSNNKPKLSGLERLSVPTWDGARKSYATWKKEFNHWMTKYGQDKEEQLQRFRKALPKGSWWTDQVKTSKDINDAWEILDTEFGNQRKLMDELLAEIDNHSPVKGDSRSLTRYATTITVFVRDMEDNGCPVSQASEAPFLMSKLLSKLQPRDNCEFGREMQREKKEENIPNLVDWLHREASLRSRGRKENDGDSNVTKGAFRHKSANNFGEVVNDDICPLCSCKHLLSACPAYQNLSVSQRWDSVKNHKRCRKCLRGSHHTKDCKRPDGQTCDKCTKNHHRSLHAEKVDPSLFKGSTEGSTGSSQARLNPKAPPFPNQDNPTSSDNNNVQGKDKQTSAAVNVAGMCPVQKVMIKDADGELIEILAMLDTGSNTSLLSKRVARKLRLTGAQTRLTMNLAGGKKRSELSEVLEVTAVPPSDQDVQKSFQVHTVQKPCTGAKTLSSKAIESYPHLKSISEKLHISGGTVDLLIGTDFVDPFVDIHTVCGESGEPVAKKNCFGWYVLGPVDTAEIPHIQSVTVNRVNAVVEDIHKLVQQDSLGVRPTELCSCSDKVLKESKFVKALNESTMLVDGRIHIRMPWKEKGPPKFSNFDIALKRLHSAEKSFKKKECHEVVNEEVQKLLDQDFVTKVPPEQVDHSQPEWYLPLQAVFTPDKSSTKVRLVFDSSSKGHDGLSLNDHLEKGPNYINCLPDVLTAWRWNEVAYSGDIRKMFNQVIVHPSDQVYHRFLWRRNPNDPPEVYQWKRLSFGDKPAPDIATNAVNFLAKKSQEEFPSAAKELQNHTYVDDIGGSTPTAEVAVQMTSDIDKVLGKGHFIIKVWHSNNKEVDQSGGEQFTDFLGHKWDKLNDKFSLKKDSVSSVSQEFTKRTCLASLAQLWDPIGLVTPVTIKFRIDLQELWMSGYDWDETLPDNVQQKWSENLEAMNRILTYEFDRKLKPAEAVGEPQVHGFSDGGEQAYGAVIFLRWQLSDGNYICVPVMSKAFVAPLKKKTVPRLELLGCLALTRMYTTCCKALDFANFDKFEKAFWVDSKTVLSWLRTPPREFRPFVSVRVAEIQESVGVEDFHYIRSKSNPADTLTRGIVPEQLSDWMSGPEFLKVPESAWPAFEDDTEVSQTEDKKERRPSSKKPVSTNAADVSREDAKEKDRDNPVLAHLLKTCSSFKKVRRVLAYVYRFTKAARGQETSKGCLTVQELKASETQLIKWCQLNLDTKLDDKLIPKADQDGVIRAHGRLEDIRSLPQDLKNPVILPRNHQFVELLLKHLHAKRCHCGYKSLMYETRRKYWIIGLRSMARGLVNRCVTCRKLRKKPLDQLMGQLPTLRVAVGFPPFSCTAMDMFGPLHIRLNRRTLQEAQVIIFTCTTTRAIHLELVTDKSSDTFLMAFRRFACIRGNPNICYSDHGTNFVGAQDYLKEIMRNWDIPKIQNVLSEEFECDFKWEWNIPTASHQNGVVETLIKSVRQALNCVCKNQTFTEEQWRTFLAEVTYMVNGRPLYPSSDNIWEAPPITPNQILLGQHNPPPQPDFESRVNPRDLVRCVQSRVCEFWNSWLKYFAPHLLPRNKWFRTRDNLQVGDLVLEVDPKHKRTKWSMAIIVATYPGSDGLVRKVRIKTKDGEYDRPIHKLCLIATNHDLSGQ